MLHLIPLFLDWLKMRRLMRAATTHSCMVMREHAAALFYVLEFDDPEAICTQCDEAETMIAELTQDLLVPLTHAYGAERVADLTLPIYLHYQKLTALIERARRKADDIRWGAPFFMDDAYAQRPLYTQEDAIDAEFKRED